MRIMYQQRSAMTLSRTMVKTLRIMLEYRCYPVWLYDEDENIVDTLLPEELRSDSDLDSKFDSLQARYDALFVNNAHEFDFIGFKNEAAKAEFLEDWEKAITELREKTQGRYEIIDEIQKAFPC